MNRFAHRIEKIDWYRSKSVNYVEQITGASVLAFSTTTTTTTTTNASSAGDHRHDRYDATSSFNRHHGFVDSKVRFVVPLII